MKNTLSEFMNAKLPLCNLFLQLQSEREQKQSKENFSSSAPVIKSILELSETYGKERPG